MAALKSVLQDNPRPQSGDPIDFENVSEIQLDPQDMNDPSSSKFPILRRNDLNANTVLARLPYDAGTADNPDAAGVYFGENTALDYDVYTGEYTADISKRAYIGGNEGNPLNLVGLILEFVFTVDDTGVNAAAPIYKKGKLVLKSNGFYGDVRKMLKYSDVIEFMDDWFIVDTESLSPNSYDASEVGTLSAADVLPYSVKSALSTDVAYPYHYKSSALESIKLVRPDSKEREGNFVFPQIVSSAAPKVIIVFSCLVFAVFVGLVIAMYRVISGEPLNWWLEHMFTCALFLQLGTGAVIGTMLSGSNPFGQEPIVVMLYPLILYVFLLACSEASNYYWRSPEAQKKFAGLKTVVSDSLKKRK